MDGLGEGMQRAFYMLLIIVFVPPFLALTLWILKRQKPAQAQRPWFKAVTYFVYGSMLFVLGLIILAALGRS